MHEHHERRSEASTEKANTAAQDPGPAVIVVDPATDPRWEALVSGRATSVFNSPAWARVLAATYDFQLRARLAARDGEAAHGGIAYAELDDFLDPRLSSLPFSDYSDPIADDEDTWDTLMGDLVTGRTRIDLRCLDNGIPARDERFAAVGTAAWHGVDLERDRNDIWMGLHASARRAIRKADGAGVIVKVASDEDDLRAFYDLHLRVRKYKYGLLAQPYSFFRNIWTEFVEPGNGFLLLAHHDGAAIGGIFFLVWQDVLYYKFNASEISSLEARPNDRLLWEGIQLGQERGLRLLDFGLSDLEQPGLLRYKQKYATEEKTITRLRHSPPGTPSDADQSARRMLGGLTALLVGEDVPDDLTARAGDLLYRYFG